MSSESPRKMELEDLEYLTLELKGPAIYNHLSIFIRDPSFPELYWFSKFIVKPGLIIRRGKSLQYIDRVDIQKELNLIPCLEKTLPFALSNILKEEARLSHNNNPTQTVVGVAYYDGPNRLSLNTLTALVGMKYLQKMKPMNRN